MTQEDIKDIFKMASTSVYTSTTVLSPDTLLPTPSTSSGMKTPENTQEDSHDRQLADEGYPNIILL
jgi:hypothetical protein